MILEARGLATGYRGRRVGEGLEVGLEAGHVIALLGPNGCGKTTLLKTLIGLLPPLAGTVALEGRALDDFSVAERARRLAYVPQVHAGVFPFTVADVVLMGRTAHHGLFSRPSRADETAASRALERLGIAALAARPYTMISGGERQLALIARALAGEPRVVVLDEPTASLDFGNQGRVLREMRALASSGLAVLFTTHDPNATLHYADETALMRDGRIVACGPTGGVVTRARLEDLYRCTVDEVGTAADRAFLPR